MPRKLHALIRAAKASAEAYKVKPGNYGCFNVWRFRDWDRPESGWRIVASAMTREAAEIEILDRLGLLDTAPKPKPPEEPFGYFDWSGL